MRRREFITLVSGAAAWPFTARAQQPGKVNRIGLFGVGNAAVPNAEAVLITALRELGWIEGKNLLLERRYANNQLDRLPGLAAELVSLNVDVIVANGTLAPLAAKRATSTIPIVMSSAGDPIGSGLIASLAQPGGNVTGLSVMSPDLGGKRLEMLRELLPRVFRVAVLWNAANPYSALVFKETQTAAASTEVELYSLEVRSPSDLDTAFQSAIRQRPDAMITVDDPLTISHRKQISTFAATQRLPAIHGLREFVDVGGLMSYGAHLVDLFRRTAGYVGKILGGAKPSSHFSLRRKSQRPLPSQLQTPSIRSSSTIRPTKGPVSRRLPTCTQRPTNRPLPSIAASSSHVFPDIIPE